MKYRYSIHSNIDKGLRLREAHKLLQAIKSETSGHFEYGLLTIVRCAENPAFYFAKVLLYILSNIFK